MDFVSNMFGSGSGSYGGFGGSPSDILNFLKPTVNAIPQDARGTVTGGNAGAPSTWDKIQTLIGDGFAGYKLYTAADLASQQIKAGQYPTVIGQNGGVSGTANVAPVQFSATGSSSWILLTVVAVVAILLLRK